MSIASDETNFSVRHGLTFFKGHISDCNVQRLKFNSSKNMVKYLTSSYQYLNDLKVIDTPLGILSFSIYYVRLAINIGLIFHAIHSEQISTLNWFELSMELINDVLWGTCNLVQFFWWTYKNSVAAGLAGMQLEVFAQTIDFILMIVRYIVAIEANKGSNTTSDFERKKLNMEWRYQQAQLIRSLIHGLVIICLLSLIAFSLTTISVTPFIFLVNMVSNLIRIQINQYKNEEILQLMALTMNNLVQLKQERNRRVFVQIKDGAKIAFDFIFIPIHLFLFITMPISISIICALTTIAFQFMLNQYIDKQIKLEQSNTRDISESFSPIPCLHRP